MPNSPISYKVEGVDETIDAFNQVRKEWDQAGAAEAAGEAILPDVRAKSRRATGAMQAGWGVQSDEEEGNAVFLNTQYYYSFQEFGSVYVEPTFAIPRAFYENEDAVLQAYEDAIMEAAEDAGFPTGII